MYSDFEITFDHARDVVLTRVAPGLNHDRGRPGPAAPVRGPLRRGRPRRPDEIFSDAQVTDLIARIRRVDASADPSDDQATA